MNERWEIQWVREYRQFVVEPPADFEFSSDEWMELSFDTIAEAMDWIDDTLREQDAVDPIPEPIASPNVVDATPPDIPAYQPRGERVTSDVEPPRLYSPGENVPRRGILNPIADQTDSDARQARRDQYAQMVGFQ